MEEYFTDRGNKFYAGESLEELRPQWHYLTGITCKETEMARNHSERILKYDDLNKPMSPLEPVYDAKWRFNWKIGKRPDEATDNHP
jgi:hypothetical protein